MRGTRLGRQELDGEMIEDRADALWPRGLIEARRVAAAPELGADRRGGRSAGLVGRAEPMPAASSSPGWAATAAPTCWPTAPASGHAPLDWARAAIGAYRMFEADRIVAEVNQGGDMVRPSSARSMPACRCATVRATRGKWLRAEPVAALYEQGRVAHVGAFPALEDEMCDFGPDGLSGGQSPDRLDALVWALTELVAEGSARAARALRVRKG